MAGRSSPVLTREMELRMAEAREKARIYAADISATLRGESAGSRSIPYSRNVSVRSRGFNCPNCGAPNDGERCEYCGTEFSRVRG